MAEIDILAELSRDNPFARAMDLQRYADALRIYFEAAKNVEENGAICGHPRTGAPMENPYLRIQEQQGRIMAKIRRINADRIVNLLRMNSNGAQKSSA